MRPVDPDCRGATPDAFGVNARDLPPERFDGETAGPRALPLDLFGAVALLELPRARGDADDLARGLRDEPLEPELLALGVAFRDPPPDGVALRDPDLPDPLPLRFCAKHSFAGRARPKTRIRSGKHVEIFTMYDITVPPRWPKSIHMGNYSHRQLFHSSK